MEITFDPTKDAENRRKHGISLARARDFDANTAVYEVDTSQDYGEIRVKALGWFKAKLYTLTSTDEPSGAVRAISFRKATREERRHYAQET